VQEALTNVARHASVKQVVVRLWATPDSIGTQIEDKGAGFDPQLALRKGESSGLVGMRERATLLGGDLTIESVVGGGTCITAEFPLAEWARK
jgi:signal transduction histidine kinase